MKQLSLTLPAGMVVQIRPLETDYPTTGAKVAVVFDRADGGAFDREDCQLLATYLLAAIDAVSAAHVDAPPVPVGVQKEGDKCEEPGCTAPLGHEYNPTGVAPAKPVGLHGYSADDPDSLEHMAKRFEEAGRRGDAERFYSAAKEARVRKVPSAASSAALTVAMRKRDITHEEAEASLTGTACFYCHTLDPSEEHLAKCRALNEVAVGTTQRADVVIDPTPRCSLCGKQNPDAAHVIECARKATTGGPPS